MIAWVGLGVLGSIWVILRSSHVLPIFVSQSWITVKLFEEHFGSTDLGRKVPWVGSRALQVIKYSYPYPTVSAGTLSVPALTGRHLTDRRFNRKLPTG